MGPSANDVGSRPAPQVTALAAVYAAASLPKQTYGSRELTTRLRQSAPFNAAPNFLVFVARPDPVAEQKWQRLTRVLATQVVRRAGGAGGAGEQSVFVVCCALGSQRYAALRSAFADRFGREPEFFARAPGRVNLIGEHIDYSGYSVLPMAIEQDIVVAVGRRTDGAVHLANLNAERYPPRVFADVLHMPLVDPQQHHWSNYTLSAYQIYHREVVLELDPATAGFNLLFDGTVPSVDEPSGLLTAATGFWLIKFLGHGLLLAPGNLAPPPAGPSQFGNGQGLGPLEYISKRPRVSLRHAYESKLISKGKCFSCDTYLKGLLRSRCESGGGNAYRQKQLADMAIRGERFVGVESGGMDQSISLMGELGMAKRIDFAPLQAIPVPLPEQACFVIANSLVVSDKAVTAPHNYNLRVAECKLAAALLFSCLAAQRGPTANGLMPPPRSNLTLKDVQDAFRTWSIRAFYFILESTMEISRNFVYNDGLYGLTESLLGCISIMEHCWCTCPPPIPILVTEISFDEMLAEVDAHLHQEPYHRAELAELLGLSVSAFDFLNDAKVRLAFLKVRAKKNKGLWATPADDEAIVAVSSSRRGCMKKAGHSSGDVHQTESLEKDFLSRFPVAGDDFRLHQRAKHVFSEAARVFRFEAVCRDAAAAARLDSTTKPNADVEARTLLALGDLMNASQASCRDLFQCSSIELDDLTSLSRSLGAHGARLTGAGWGGCTVSLVQRGGEEDFISKLLLDFYPAHEGLKGHDPTDVVFATLPGSGACVLYM